MHRNAENVPEFDKWVMTHVDRNHKFASFPPAHAWNFFSLFLRVPNPFPGSLLD